MINSLSNLLQPFLFFSISAGFAVFIIALLMGLNSFIMAKDIWKKRCKKSIIKGLINEKLDWKDVSLLAERWNLNNRELRRILLVILDEVFYNENHTGKKEQIKNLIHEYDKREPFSDLPEDVKLQLNALMNDNNKDQIKHLASSLSDYGNKNQRNLKAAKNVSYWSLIVGIAGFIIGVLGLYIGYLIK